MEQFIFEGRGKGNRTGHERIAMHNIRHAINWIVGGYYNCIQDDHPEDLPESLEALKNEIYDSAMVDLYEPGMLRSNRAPKEMRFAGEAFCRAYIDWKLSRDGDVMEIADVANWR